MKSILLSRIVGELSKLPSIGDRSALRLALHLLRQPEATSVALSAAIEDFRRNIKYCECCNNISDTMIAISHVIDLLYVSLSK